MMIFSIYTFLPEPVPYPTGDPQAQPGYGGYPPTGQLPGPPSYGGYGTGVADPGGFYNPNVGEYT